MHFPVPAKRCDILHPLENGFILPPDCLSSRKHFTDKCIFRCDMGFTLMNKNEAIECQKNGRWSSDLRNMTCSGKCFHLQVLMKV